MQCSQFKAEPRQSKLASVRAGGAHRVVKKRKSPFENRNKHRNFSFVRNLIPLNNTIANINET